jgi:GxxExxY protein
MPIQVNATIRHLDQNDFGRIAYDVMGHVFEIHNEFGRFFDEKIYKRELSRRCPAIQLEIPIEVRFDSFRKLYFLDALADGGAAFEFKTVESLTDRHRSQLLHYLLMTDLSHGKLVNMRTEQVQHEFVNTMLRSSDRTGFEVTGRGWQEIGDKPVMEWCTEFLRDVGTCLDLSLYEEALIHLLGGEEQTLQEIEVVSGGCALGRQKFRLVAPSVAFKITALTDDPSLFENHARRLLEHTSLKIIQWINVTKDVVSFQTIRK